MVSGSAPDLINRAAADDLFISAAIPQMQRSYSVLYSKEEIPSYSNESMIEYYVQDNYNISTKSIVEPTLSSAFILAPALIKR